ncbi:MAG: hypothetical protein WKF29_02055 [Thermoleophilaceae bacterium]
MVEQGGARSDASVLAQPHPLLRSPALGTALAVLMAAALGLAAGRIGLPLLVPVAVLAAMAASIAGHWRPLLVGMLFYLPVSGLPVLLLYPDTAPGALAKDVLFVLPAYAGAAAALVVRREKLGVPGAPLFLMVSLALLVLVQALNPSVPKPLVAMIGVKVWLFYLPMLWLGYHLFSRKSQVQQLLKWMLVVAMLPCVVGVIEALLVYGGKEEFAYGLYGPAASAATQDFAAFSFDGTSSLKRLPSIFQFVSQYWLFATATIAVGYGAWRGNRSSRVLAWFGPLAIAVAILATMTSGLRAAFIFSPFMLLLIALFEGVSFRRILAVALGSVLAIVGALAILRVPAGPLAELTGSQGTFILEFFGDGFTYAIEHALLGLGTGVDSNGLSYAFGSDDYDVIYATVGGIWWESWYLKAFLELGVAGLILLLALIGALVRRSLIVHRRLVDRELRSMSAAFLALFIWNVIYAVKTAYVDLDPMSVYLWLFLGMQWRLVTMNGEHSPGQGDRTARRRTPA